MRAALTLVAALAAPACAFTGPLSAMRALIALVALAAPACAFTGPLSQRVGTHLVLEIWGVDAGRLDDRHGLERVLREASAAAGLTVLEAAFHRFEPQGVTGVLVLSESHVSVHTWPELGYAAVDLFSCGGRRELPCSESLGRSGGGGEVTMHLRRAGGGAQAGQPAEWTCADGSRAIARYSAEPYEPDGGGARSAAHPLEAGLPAAVGDARAHELKDLWAAVEALMRGLQPSDVQLRRFERGVPAARPARS